MKKTCSIVTMEGREPRLIKLEWPPLPPEQGPFYIESSHHLYALVTTLFNESRIHPLWSIALNLLARAAAVLLLIAENTATIPEDAVSALSSRRI